MKKTVNKICGLAAIALLAACTAIDHDTTTLDEVLQARTTLTQAASYYLGTNAAGNDAFSLCLTSGGVSVDYTTTSGRITDYSYKGTGYVILIDSLFAAPSGNIDFPTGTFDVKESFNAIYSIVAHNGVAASAAEKVRAVDGTVTVTKAGNDYTVTIDATSINGAKLNVSYTGAIEVGPDVTYIQEPLTPSTQNFVATDLSFVSENYVENGVVYFSIATLTLTGADARIVIDEIAGPPRVIGAEPKRPAAGTYALTEWTYDDDTFVPGEIYRGALTGSYAWLLSGATSFSKMWYFVDAQMVVTETDTYAIAITATSVFGSTITVTYEE
jgi:hypothetical protein